MTCPAQPPFTPHVGLTETNGQWYMHYQNNTYGPNQYPPIGVPCNSNADFTFTIQGNTAGKFDSTWPITVAQGPDKPNGNVLYGQITVTSHSDSVLQIHDLNTVAGSMNYVLHFTDNTTLDPIITNGGGCCTTTPPPIVTSYSSTTSFAAGLVIGFLAALLLVAVVRFAARRA